jgi:hypothetical protein
MLEQVACPSQQCNCRDFKMHQHFIILLNLGFCFGSLLMLIQLLDFYIVWVWWVLLTFWTYVLPPSSGSNCVGWMSFCAYAGFCFKRTAGGKWGWCLIWWLFGTPVATSFLVHFVALIGAVCLLSKLPMSTIPIGLDEEPALPPPHSQWFFRNKNLYVHWKWPPTRIWPWRRRQHVPPKCRQHCPHSCSIKTQGLNQHSLIYF